MKPTPKNHTKASLMGSSLHTLSLTFDLDTTVQ